MKRAFWLMAVAAMTAMTAMAQEQSFPWQETPVPNYTTLAAAPPCTSKIPGRLINVQGLNYACDGVSTWAQAAQQSNTASALYFVDKGGDNSDCLTPATACTSCKSVRQKLGNSLAYPVEVIFDGGTYSACQWENISFTADALTNTTGSLWVHGVTKSQTLSAGIDSGTITSATEFVVAATNVAPTITVTSGGYTAHKLRGGFLRVTGGKGKGQMWAIADNTGTVITLAGGTANTFATWAIPSVYTGGNPGMTNPFAEYVLPDNTSTFEIVQNAVSFTSGERYPNGPASNDRDGGFIGSYGNIANNQYDLLIDGMRGVPVSDSWIGGVAQVTSPMAPVVFSNFDFNDANSTNVYVANSDSVELRWLSFTQGYSAAINWNNVNRFSLFSNTNTVNTLIHLFPEGQAGNTFLEFGDVVGKAQNAGGYWFYDAYRTIGQDRFWWLGGNNVQLAGPRDAIDLFSAQTFFEFGDFVSGYSVTGLNIVGVGETARLQASTYTGNGAAREAVHIEGGNTFSSNQNVGATGQQYGFSVGGTLVQFNPALNNVQDALTGTVGQICMNANCNYVESVVNYVNNGWGWIVGGTGINSGTGLESTTSGDAGFNGNIRVGGDGGFGGSVSVGKQISSFGLNVPVVHNAALPTFAIEPWRDAGVANALTYVFSTPFAAPPVCTCNCVDTVLSNACEYKIAETTTGVTFVMNGTDVCGGICFGVR